MAKTSTGWLLIVWSTILLLIGGLLVFWPFGVVLRLMNTSDSTFQQLLFPILVLTIGYYLFVRPGLRALKRARQHFAGVRAPVVDDILQQPIVLYLRSFIDDDTFDDLSRSNRPVDPVSQMFIFPKTTEQQLEDLFESVGPVVCIGDPREKLPQLGAQRMYFRDEGSNWQEEARKLMRASKLVIMRAGNSAGLLWELRTIFEEVPLQKMIFLFIRRRDSSFAEFKKELEQLIQKNSGTHFEVPYLEEPPLTWWQKLYKSQKVYGTIVYFDENQQPQALPLEDAIKKQPFRARRSAQFAHALRLALRPAYQSLGIDLPKPSINPLYLLGGFVLVALGLLLLWQEVLHPWLIG